jgi:2-oxoglutarate/2-oxoacid ferredoxin oxidoreductase subunit beta
VREHNEAVNRLDVITPRAPLSIDHEPGTTQLVTQHDGSVLSLHKLGEHYDPSDRVAALNYLGERHALGEIVTGLLFVDPAAEDLHEGLGTVARPLNSLGTTDLVPGAQALDALNASLR